MENGSVVSALTGLGGSIMPSIVNGVHPLYINARFVIDEARDALSKVIDLIPETSSTTETIPKP